MSKAILKLDDYWEDSWPDYADVVSPDCERHIAYVPLMPWDGKSYHCIHCGSELHGYQRRCSCGQKIYGYEDNGSQVVLDAD